MVRRLNRTVAVLVIQSSVVELQLRRSTSRVRARRGMGLSDTEVARRSTYGLADVDYKAVSAAHCDRKDIVTSSQESYNISILLGP